MENDALIKDIEFDEINKLYDECLNYLKKFTTNSEDRADINKNIVKETSFNNNNNKEDETSLNNNTDNEDAAEYKAIKNEEIKTTRKEIDYKIENEIRKAEELIEHPSRLRRLSQQLPKIIITQSNSSLSKKDDINIVNSFCKDIRKEKKCSSNSLRSSLFKPRHGYGDFPKRLVSKSGMENVALISNVPFEKIRLLNDTFHTLINLRWRWIVLGTIVVHFAIWLVFAVFWYVTALAHYDFEPDPPARACVTGGRDFLTIFLASVEAQTTIGFGDRAIDEECPESIFLFIMQLILGTGLSGVLTCVVYAKLTRPEKQSRDGVGFSKKAVISMRDGHLCLMIRAWDLNYDHIIGSEFSAHFINTHKTKEGDMIRYYTKTLTMQTRQFLLWPVILVHIIDESSPLYKYTPDMAANSNYEITVSLKGASASMGTFTQSQTSYTPREIMWGHRFPPVVKYDSRKQKYVIDHKKLNATEPVETPICSAHELYSCTKAPGGEASSPPSPPPETPSSFSDKISAFVLERSSSFNKSYSKKY